MAENKQKLQVFIFEAEAKSALPTVESFCKRGFHVVVGSSRKYCAAFWSKYVHEKVHIPNDVIEPEKCQQFLLDFVKKRKFEMIVPLGDGVTELVCQKRDAFAELTKLVLTPYENFKLGRDKVETMKAAQKCGIPYPKTWYPEEQDLDEIAREVEYPVLVKPAIANGARGINFVHNPQELKEKYKEVHTAYGRTFVQELISHDGMQYKVDIIMDKDGTCLAGVVYSKIRYYPPSGGSSVLNKSVEHHEILEYAIRIARSIGWYGLCDFDFIYDVRDKKPKIMEINPRFPESFRICQAAGVDFPEILYKMASGEKVEPVTQYKTDRYLRFLPGDMMWFMTAKGQRLKTKPSFFKFFDSATTYQILSLKDPGPILAYLLENLMVLCDKKERAFRFRLKAARTKAN